MFCPNCGTNAGNAAFCSGCGTRLGGTPAAAYAPEEECVLWEGKPAAISDKSKGLLNSVTYQLTTQRLIISDGILKKSQTEIELYRVKDIMVTQTLGEKINGVGDITIASTDLMDGTVVLSNVKYPIEVKELIRSAVQAARAAVGVIQKEIN